MDCDDIFCEVCFQATHRKGNRKKHVSNPLAGVIKPKKAKASKVATNGVHKARTFLFEIHSHLSLFLKAKDDDDDDDEDIHVVQGNDPAALVGPQPSPYESPGEWFVERSRYIPLRLTYDERKYLRLVEAALSVSEYTDKVDTLGFGLSKAKRIVHQIRELCAILSGLVLAADYKLGQELFQDRNFESNAAFYQNVFELARRHKIMNPEKWGFFR